MNRRLLLNAILLISLLAHPPASAQDSGNDSAKLPLGMGYLILKNGHVITGTMTSTEDGVTVNRGNGVNVRFRYSEIDLQVQEFYEAYRTLKSRLEADDTDGHLNLASWCLRLGDIRSSNEQITYLESLNVNAAILQRMKAQLERKQQAPIVQSLPSVDGNPLDSTDETEKTSIHQSDTLSDTLPLAVLREFNSNVQPRLINGCAAARCHVGDSTKFQLVRPRGPTSIRSGVTKRNLQAAVDFVDQENPLNSKLLDYMQRSHGEQREPSYHAQSSQYQLIRNWIFALAKANGHNPEANVAMTTPTEKEVPATESHPTEELDIPFRGESSNTPINFQTESRDSQKPSEGDDPFDPDIFNRRFGKKVIQTTDREK